MLLYVRLFDFLLFTLNKLLNVYDEINFTNLHGTITSAKTIRDPARRGRAGSPLGGRCSASPWRRSLQKSNV